MIIKNSTIRVDVRFNGELEDIKNKRLKSKIDKKKISSNKITSLIPRHKWWEKIKEEIIEYPFKEDRNFKDKEP